MPANDSIDVVSNVDTLEPVDVPAVTPTMAIPNSEIAPADIRHNMMVIILLDAIFVMGFTDFQLVMQPLLVHLNASNFMIGLVSGASFMGLFGIFISPWISRRFVYKKWYLLVVHLPYIGAILLIGCGIVYSHHAGWSNQTLLHVVLILTLAHWFFSGFVSLPHQEYVVACIPASHRGRYTGWSYSIGGGLSTVSALIGGWILLHYSKPMAFGYVLLMGWAIAQGGYTLALLGRERPSPVKAVPNPWSKKMLAAFWQDKPYVGFMAVCVLNYIVVGAALSFVNVYGYRELGMIAATTAVIQVITQVIRLSTCGIAGSITDKLSAKRVYPYWYLVAALAFVPAVLIRNQYGVYLCVLLSAVYHSGIAPAATTLQYGLPSGENRPGHFTIQLLLFFFASAVGGIMIGKVCDLLPYRLVFSISFFTSIGMFLLSKRVLSSISDDPNVYS